jgi:uncharacterized tellurite resistance protein B-like protein
MHIILGALGAIITILILVKRLSDVGIDIGWLDPFKWQRRRQWKKKYLAKPVFSIEDPMEATACLLYTMIKSSGDITLEEKQFLLEIFKNDFFLSENECSSLLNTCSFLIPDSELVRNNLNKFLSSSISSFSISQKESAINLLEKAANFCTSPNQMQSAFLEEIRNYFIPKVADSKWK